MSKRETKAERVARLNTPKRKGPRLGALLDAGTSEHTVRETLAEDKRRPSLVDEVAAIKPASRKWDFTPAQRAEVDVVRARVVAGTLYISALGLARVVKARYNLPWSVGSIRAKLTEIAGGKW